VGRPFIEFVQSQAIAWQHGLYGSGRAGVESKVLSMDAATGAASVLIRYPPGWSAAADEHLDVDEEFFVLAGLLEINGTKYPARTYAHLVAGWQRSTSAAPDGAVVLAFFSAEPHAIAGPAADGLFDAARHVDYVDALAGQWGANFHAQFPPGAGRKFLRRDPRDGEETWVLGTMPLRSGRRPERHPVVEEMYLLSGELVGPLGIMQAGCYFWRPPEEWHGPFGSLTGNLMLFRTKGGPLSTEYTEHEVDFSWHPEHKPILPPELVAYGRPEPGCACY
jgi:Domain of unknown function (DUF4437)